MRVPERQGNVGAGGGGIEPHRAVQTVRKGREGRLRGALWSSPTEMLCAWQMRPALLPGLAVMLGSNWLSADI